MERHGHLIRHDEGSSDFGTGCSGSLRAKPLCWVIHLFIYFFKIRVSLNLTKGSEKPIISLSPFSYRDKVFRLWPVSDTHVSFIKEMPTNVDVSSFITTEYFV